MVPRNVNCPFISAVQGNVSTPGIISFPGEKSGFPICTNYCKQTCHSEWPLGESITTYFPFSRQKGKRPLTFSSSRKEKHSFKNSVDWNSNVVIIFRLSLKSLVSSVFPKWPMRSELIFLICLRKCHLLVSTKANCGSKWRDRLPQWMQRLSAQSWCHRITES